MIDLLTSALGLATGALTVLAWTAYLWLRKAHDVRMPYKLNAHMWQVQPTQWSFRALSCDICKTGSRGATTTFVVCSICGAYAHARCATTLILPAHCLCKQAAVPSGSTCDLGPHHEFELPVKFAQIPQPKPVATPAVTRGRRVFKPMGVMPAGLMLKHQYPSAPTPLDVEIELPSEWKAKTLLVLINGGSGGRMGDTIANDLRKLLNPLQVYNISGSCPPIGPLNQYKKVKGLQILACGGDGTVGWVLETIDKIGFETPPPVAILPLGTGNDLARVLGWGGGYNPNQPMTHVLSDLTDAQPCFLDRWMVNVQGKGENQFVMNNYFSVGVDAKVALQFHTMRKQMPDMFSSQLINKLWYIRFGISNFFSGACAELGTKIGLKCDGEDMFLGSAIQSVIVANINSYGGGATLWKDATDGASPYALRAGTLEGSHSMTDGYLEVVAVTGTGHLGSIQMKVTGAIRVAQCKNIEMTLKKPLPIQIDGEPQMPEPCAATRHTVITLTHHNQTVMLRKF